MFLKLVEGSAAHHDACYLASMYGTSLHEAIELAIRMQAELTRHLDCNLQVTLWGGPPFDRLKVEEME